MAAPDETRIAASFRVSCDMTPRQVRRHALAERLPGPHTGGSLPNGGLVRQALHRGAGLTHGRSAEGGDETAVARFPWDVKHFWPTGNSSNGGIRDADTVGPRLNGGLDRPFAYL